MCLDKQTLCQKIASSSQSPELQHLLSNNTLYNLEEFIENASDLDLENLMDYKKASDSILKSKCQSSFVVTPKEEKDTRFDMSHLQDPTTKTLLTDFVRILPNDKRLFNWETIRQLRGGKHPLIHTTLTPKQIQDISSDEKTKREWLNKLRGQWGYNYNPKHQLKPQDIKLEEKVRFEPLNFSLPIEESSEESSQSETEEEEEEEEEEEKKAREQELAEDEKKQNVYTVLDRVLLFEALRQQQHILRDFKLDFPLDTKLTHVGFSSASETRRGRHPIRRFRPDVIQWFNRGRNLGNTTIGQLYENLVHEPARALKFCSQRSTYNYPDLCFAPSTPIKDVLIGRFILGTGLEFTALPLNETLAESSRRFESFYFFNRSSCRKLYIIYCWS